ncbi:hypothetical protein PR202_ga25246 [Eleusine coracana subsp. coracana]|uniref:Uncharacterized protein n=1 Tax=Eleusine coracana subsp. coracana TaxID=191504 RepID=A0AAV5DAV1_ELECO|nr:hypothetical protein PR202_ga25246 [Eleusine coracana subsp. coracana]
MDGSSSGAPAAASPAGRAHLDGARAEAPAALLLLLCEPRADRAGLLLAAAAGGRSRGRRRRDAEEGAELHGCFHFRWGGVLAVARARSAPCVRYFWVVLSPYPARVPVVWPAWRRAWEGDLSPRPRASWRVRTRTCWCSRCRRRATSTACSTSPRASSAPASNVTFLHTDHSLRRLGAAAAACSSPRLRFLSIPDGLPDDHPRLVDTIPELLDSLWTKASGSYRALLSSPLCNGGGGDDGFPPVTFVVADGILPFAVDVAEELGVPAIAFRTVSACSVLAYHSIPNLIARGELPFPEGGGADLDAAVRGVPGMESFLRRRDLPVQCRRMSSTHDDEPLLKTVVPATAATTPRPARCS